MNRHFLMMEKFFSQHFLTGFYWVENSVMIWKKLMSEKTGLEYSEWFWDYLGFHPLNVEE